jgi:hypothetical protein
MPKFSNQKMIKLLKNTGRLWSGYRQFRLEGQTPDRAYQSLVNLFTATNGWSNDLLHRLTRRRASKKATAADPNRLAKLRKDGLIELGKIMGTDACSGLLNWAEQSPGNPRPEGDYGDKPNFCSTRSKIDTFHLRAGELLKKIEIQDLISRPDILSLVTEYFGGAPYLSACVGWWSTSNHVASDSARQNAQMFHFDMDRIKWLKLFFYINDVSEQNGPHIFVEGSHRSGNQPKAIRRKGYQRILDQEIARFYPPEKVKSIVGPAGTAFLADTRGYHKGLTPVKGERLVFVIEFSSGLFGVNTKLSEEIQITSPQLQRAKEEALILLENFNFKDLPKKI